MYQLFQGDCLDIMKKEIKDKSIDCIVTDLPFGTTRNSWDSIIPLVPMWEQINRVIKDNGAIILFAQSPFDKVLGASNLKMLRYEYIWKKSNGTGFLNAKKMPMKVHENILVFYKKLPTYNPQMREGKPYKATYSAKNLNTTNYGSSKLEGVIEVNNTGTRYPTDILEFAYDKEKLHPTQKPVSLMEFLVKTYSNEGETVLDLTAGSGTLGVAAERCNRNSIMIERDDKYCEIIRRRMENSN